MLDSWGGSVDQQVGVLIVGAGPVGLCHALWLRQHDVDVLVIDADLRSHREEWVVLGPDALDVLNRVGLQSELANARVDYDAVAVVPRRDARDDRTRRHIAVKKPRLLRLPALRDQGPIALVNRATLEEALERRARELGAQIERGQRLQRVDIRPTHCEARVVAAGEAEGAPPAHLPIPARDSARRVLAQWVVGTEGHRSIVRRDLRAAFRPIAEPRVASIVRIAGRRSVDVEGAVQLTTTRDAVHTVWALGGEELLWVTQTIGPTIPPGIDVDQHAQELITPLVLSTDAIHYGIVTDAFLEREAPLVGIEVEHVLHRHAMYYRPCVADPLGRGRAWTSGPAAQLIAPALGLDDTLGLLEVPDLGLLLGFGADDGMSGLPTLTPRLYHERRARLQQHALGAHPLGSDGTNPRGWSSQDRAAVANAFPFLTRVASSVRSPGSPAETLEQPRG